MTAVMIAAIPVPGAAAATTGPDGVLRPESGASRRIFWLSALAFATLTAVLPPLCFPTFRSDVLEQIIIGREWVLGSAKHPALTTWIMQLFWCGLGHSTFAPSVAASACAVATMWAVWRLGRHYVGERESLLGSLCLTAYWYTNVGGAAMYNNNVTLIALWHLTILAFHHALVSNRLRAWILTGVLLGCSLLCKYSAVVLAISMTIFIVAEPEGRRRVRTAGPWLAALAATLVFLPHAAVMLLEFGGSYAYLEAKRVSLGLLPFGLLMGRDWLVQAVIAAPVVLSVLPLVDWRLRAAGRPSPSGFSPRFVPAMFGLPILIQTLLQFALRVNYLQRSYGSHLWVLAGLCMLTTLRHNTEARRWRIAIVGTVALAAAQLISLPIATASAHRFSTRENARFYPGRELAGRLDEIWAGICPGPCRFLAAESGKEQAIWAAGVYSRHQPHVIDPRLGRWARDEQLNAQGGIVVWKLERTADADTIPAEIRRRFPRARSRGAVDLRYVMQHPQVPSVTLGVAVVEPRGVGRLAAEPPPTLR